MENILGVVGGVPKTMERNDDDFSDRLNYRYTSIMLVIFAVVVSTKQYVGDPINCWVPAHFTGNHEEYANNYCWIRNTYYLPLEEYIPKEHETEKRHVIPYYQWVPLILLVQALFFYMPCMVWRTLNSHSGIDVNNIVETAETLQRTDKIDDKQETLEKMTKQMERYLDVSYSDNKGGFTISLKHLISRTCCICFGKRKGNYLVVLYLFCKLLFIANCLGQLFVLNAFLSQDFHLYGFNVLKSMAIGEDWTASPRFPRVTMCDFKVRRLGNVQRYTVQCVLPINLFNEKIYLFIWCWMVFCAALLTISFLSWLLKFAFRTDRNRFIKKHLGLLDKLETEHDRMVAAKFVEKHLRQDGVFVLRLVGINTNSITLTEFIGCLWDSYRKKPMNDITPTTDA